MVHADSEHRPRPPGGCTVVLLAALSGRDEPLGNYLAVDLIQATTVPNVVVCDDIASSAASMACAIASDAVAGVAIITLKSV
ncbi:MULTISPECIES: hypothetical protein [Xanthomonas]|uniref:hypothetical protein n=1 Tax=Xanthomonas TaxID=338 RepID=UPI00292F35F9|nr:hypothetical protein [Xanthomonas dyei]WOB56379.1 hypothetical protein NYR95_03550 [Xanthomonas dyei]